MTATSAIEANLAPHPLNAIYWSMVAGLLYTLGISLILQIVYPPFEAVLTGEADDAGRKLWMVSTLIQFAILIRICTWAQKTTGTPFAGELFTSSNWLAAAVIMGPIVHLGSRHLIGTLLGGDDPAWAYNESADLSFVSRTNLGLAMITYVVVLAPLIEEIGFRGIALGCLLGRKLDPNFAIALTAAGFTALHLQYSALGLIPVFMTGLFLGWLRVASGTVAVPIVAHMAANGASVWLLSLAPNTV
ncbi:MAG: type II CAAX endopeptidase family protein [Pseudomonadota bacterium]